MRSKWIAPSLVAALVLILAGVAIYGLKLASDDDPGDQASEPHDPFKTRWDMGDGPLLELTGHSRGHAPGEASEFALHLESGPERWEDTYCAFLVDERGVVLDIARDQINLDPGAGSVRSLRMELPEDFPEGPYGLVLLIPGRGSQVVTIWVGQPQAGSVKPWPEVDSCP